MPPNSIGVLLVLGPSVDTLLGDTLVALEAQSDQGFELIIDARRLDESGSATLPDALARFSGGLADRTVVVAAGKWGKRRALAAALEGAAHGLYAPIDLDVIPFGRWIESFVSLAADAPDQVLRTPAAQQSFIRSRWPDGRSGHEATTAPEVLEVASSAAELGTFAMPRSCASLLVRAADRARRLEWGSDLFAEAVERCGLKSGAGEVTSLRRRWGASTER